MSEQSIKCHIKVKDDFFQPLAEAIAGHPALGAWEAMNELEGSIIVSYNFYSYRSSVL